jgi:hypothetical protein
MRLLTTIYLTLISISLWGQDYFSFKQGKINEIEVFEKQFNSTRLSTQRIYLSEEFYPYTDKYELEFPISYIRTGDTLINKYKVEYFFTASDSKLRLVVYDWDLTQTTDMLYEQAEIMKIERKKFQTYNDKYDQLFQLIKEQLGAPLKNEKLKETITSNSAYKERTTRWKTDNMTVEQNLIFTTTDNELGTFRVRVKVYWD